MGNHGITVKCETEGQASNLAKLIKTQTGLEVNVKGGSSMCRHPFNKVKQYYHSDLRFCTQCNQRVVLVNAYDTKKDGKGDGTPDGCLHPPDSIKEENEYRVENNDGDYESHFGTHCKKCDCEVKWVKYHLLPDLSDAPLKIDDSVEADGDAPGIDHLLVMPERVDDTAGRGEPAEA